MRSQQVTVARLHWGVYEHRPTGTTIRFGDGAPRCGCQRGNCRHAAAARPIWMSDVIGRLRSLGVRRADGGDIAEVFSA